MVRSARAALSEMEDEELVRQWRAGAADALELLLQRYRRLARSQVRTFFLVGGDAEDIEQEGLIGLYKAVRDYRSDRQPSFRAFAELCVTRQVLSAIKAATRQKHQPLNRYVPISGAPGSEVTGDANLRARLASSERDPVDEVICRERMQSWRGLTAGTLTGFELDVLWLFLEGKSYGEIGNDLGRRAKSIDNALQRVKRKLGPLLDRDDSGPHTMLVA
jgi:RNA polymerase sporulation-specific sigma factor